MPNEMGGSQTHPSYGGGRETQENQIVVGLALYTITFNSSNKAIVESEGVDGRRRLFDESFRGQWLLVPDEVKEKVEKLRPQQP